MTLDTARKRWFAHGTTGFLLMGTGVSVTLDAAMRRITETHWEIWVGEGTLGLVLLMAGMAYFGSAVRYLVHMDRIAEYSDRRARHRARKQSARAHQEREAATASRKKRRRRRQQTCSIELDTLPHEKGARRRLFS